MSTKVETETLDHVCATARNPKISKPCTWTNIFERTIWTNVAKLLFFHAGFTAALIFYGFRLNTVPVKWQTSAWAICVMHIAGVGVTAGAHRLWTHRTYKAKLRLRILLMLMYSVMGMNPLFDWIRDHRVHHKFVETDADPHNAERGFFFSHMGWLMLKRHPDFTYQARRIDMSDVLADPMIVFNKKYATALKIMFCFAIPTAIPVLFWGESVLNAVLTQCFIRYVLGLHFVWSINSVAHHWGFRPYNRFIKPVDNLIISLCTVGEGSHNYHHTFPWDYKASEMLCMTPNVTTVFINGMAKLGWAYDLREASPELVEKVVQRIGHKSVKLDENLY